MAAEKWKWMCWKGQLGLCWGGKPTSWHPWSGNKFQPKFISETASEWGPFINIYLFIFIETLQTPTATWATPWTWPPTAQSRHSARRGSGRSCSIPWPCPRPSFRNCSAQGRPPISHQPNLVSAWQLQKHKCKPAVCDVTKGTFSLWVAMMVNFCLYLNKQQQSVLQKQCDCVR